MLTKKMSVLNKTTRKNLVMGYWLLLPLVFFLYLLTFAAVKGSSVGSMLTSIPSLTLTFLLSCLMLVQAYVLYRLTMKETDQKLLNRFLLVSMLQQLITANLIGTALVYFYRQSVNVDRKNDMKAAKKTQAEAYALMGMISLLSLLVVVLTLANQ